MIIDITNYVSSSEVILAIKIILLVSTLIFLLLAIKEYFFSWIFSIISSLLVIYLGYIEHEYTLIFFASYLLIFSFYGLINWHKNRNSGRCRFELYDYTIKSHLIIIFIVLLVSFFVNNILYHLFGYKYSTFESIILCFSLAAVYLLERKAILSWVYWIFISAFSIIFYLLVKSYFFILFNILHLIISIYGYYSWKRCYLKKHPKEITNGDN